MFFLIVNLLFSFENLFIDIVNNLIILKSWIKIITHIRKRCRLHTNKDLLVVLLNIIK